MKVLQLLYKNWSTETVVGVNGEFWNATIEKVVVHSEHEITLIFTDGMELEWNF